MSTAQHGGNTSPPGQRSPRDRLAAALVWASHAGARGRFSATPASLGKHAHAVSAPLERVQACESSKGSLKGAFNRCACLLSKRAITEAGVRKWWMRKRAFMSSVHKTDKLCVTQQTWKIAY